MGFFDNLFDPEFYNPGGQEQEPDTFDIFGIFDEPAKNTGRSPVCKEKPRQYDPDRDDNPDHEDDNDDW